MRITRFLSSVGRLELAAAALVLTACGGGSSSESDPGSPTGAPSTLQTHVDYAASARSLDVTPTLDAGAFQEVDVPITGAMLMVVGGNGTRYTLLIPADALRSPTRIRMQAVTDLAGMPAGVTAVHGVQLEPSGLQFMAPATLSIEPAVPVPLAQQVLYAYEGTGTDLHRFPGELGSATQLKLMHFSGYGMATLARETSVSGVFVNVVPAGLEARLQAAMSAAVLQLNDATITGEEFTTTMGALLAQYETEVLKPMHAAAGKSCANALTTLSAELTFSRQRQLLGMEADTTAAVQTFVTLRKVCFEEADKRCRVSGNIEELLLAHNGLARQAQLLAVDDAGTGSQELTAIDHCGRYELQFDSTLTYDGSVISTLGFGRLSVATRVPLKLVDQQYLEGDASIAYTDTATRFNCSSPGCGYYLVKGTSPGQATVRMGRPVFTPLQGIDVWALGKPVAQTGTFRVEFDPQQPTELIDSILNLGPKEGIVDINAKAGIGPSRETLWAGFYAEVNTKEIGPDGSYLWDADWAQASYPVMFERSLAPVFDSKLAHMVAITNARLVHMPN